MLEAGIKAPNFTLPDKDGNPISLYDLSARSSGALLKQDQYDTL